MDKKILVRYIVRESMGLVSMGAALFWSAGTFQWWQAWAALAVMLGSWWAAIPSALGAILLIVRTALEDCTLQKELAGYTEYVRQVRYRLLPGIW